MTPINVVLLACGSFNPPTNMHLRMFEIARDYLHRLGNYVVIGGLLSPVHDSYGKKDLVPAKHRLAMAELSLESTNWIKLSDWECEQESWSRTKVTIQHHQNLLNAALNNVNHEDLGNNSFHWISNNVKNGCTGPVQVKLLCGADLLESFGTPGLWADEDIEAIVGQHGLIVVTREGANPLKFVYESDILTRHMRNIHLVTEWITNEISSTKIRRALRRSESVRYLVPDPVIDYIHQHGLYGTKDVTKYLTQINNNLQLLTPSPTDVVMESPSQIDNRCINICNNNIFTTTSKNMINSSPPPSTILIQNDENNKLNTTTYRHPGQAVKILTANTGEHTVLRDNEVRNNNNNDNTIKTQMKKIAKSKNNENLLKMSQSCTDFSQHSNSTESSTSPIIVGAGLFKSTRSHSEVGQIQNCDENMIRFIFTKHGIQVISDIETVV